MSAKFENQNRVKEFLSREYQRLVSYVYNYLDTRRYSIDAEDIVQDIALNIFEKFDFNKPIENIAGYFFRAIRNRIIDYQRKPSKNISLDEFSGNEMDSILFQQLMNEMELNEKHSFNDKLKSLLIESLEELNPDQQAIIIENEWEGTSFDELSQRWNVPLGTLLSRKSRAVNKLKQIVTNKIEKEDML